jgi:hypothetical protein
MSTRLHAWASTFPWDCLVRETGCCSASHKHTPMVGDPCAICGNPLGVNEECYYVTEPPNPELRSDDQPVCWRHVRDAPTRIRL